MAAASGRVRAMAVGVLAGAAAGLPLGVLNRVFQRVTALMAGHTPEFSWGGTLAIVAITILPFAIPAGLLFVGVRRWLRGGVLYGLLLLCVLGVPYLWAAPMGLDTTGSPWVNRLMYGSLFVLQGLLLPPAVAWLERRLPPPRGRWAVTAGYGVLVAVGLVGCGLLLLLAFDLFG